MEEWNVRNFKVFFLKLKVEAMAANGLKCKFLLELQTNFCMASCNIAKLVWTELERRAGWKMLVTE